MDYTTIQKAFIVEAYFCTCQIVNGEKQFSIRECITAFQEKFPEAAVVYKQFVNILNHCVKIFRETGCVTRKEGSGATKKRTAENIDAVQQIITNEPTTSIRRLKQQTDLSYGTCQTILKKDLHMIAYHLTAVQELRPPDYAKRVEFCHWFFANINNNDILDKTFFSDEAWFTLQGYINSQNTRMWSAVNPHFYREAPLQPQKVGVWLGFSRRRLIGPIFFNGTVTGQRYRQEILEPFINSLHDDELREGFFQQDGAPAHTAYETLGLLREYFNERLISAGTQIPFPPRSCDLTVLDFFVWPYLKNNVFRTPVNTIEELRERIILKVEELNNSPQILQNVFNALKRRLQICLQEDGHHIQHLL